MNIIVDWGTRIISILKSELTLIQSSPTEIYEMNIDDFRIALKNAEDDANGIAVVDTHRHNTEVTVSGITLARVVELINGFTVTFEDDQYAVNLVGANSNIADKVNVNQVSIRSANSAGLTNGDILGYDVEGGFNVRDILRLLIAVAAGDATGMESSSVTFKSLDNATNRILATLAGGSRTVTTRNPT